MEKDARISGLDASAGIGVLKMSDTGNRSWRLKSGVCEIATMKGMWFQVTHDAI